MSLFLQDIKKPLKNFIEMQNNIKIVTGKEEFKKIQIEWSELVKKIKNRRFFHYYEWYESYINALETNLKSIFFVVLSNSTCTEAIIPLKKVKEFCFDILELPNHSHLTLRDIIYPECLQKNESIQKLVAHFISSKKFKWDFIRLSCLLPDSCALSAFRNYSGIKIIRKLGSCCYIPTQSYEKIEANLSRSMRKILKRKLKKAKAIGEIKNRSYKTLSELTKVYPIFLDLEPSGWKGIKGTKSAIKCNQDLIKFYYSLLSGFSVYGECIIDILYIDERPISGQFGFIINDTCYLLKCGYDVTVSQISPGNLHRDLLLKKYAQKPNIKYFNLVSGEYILWHKQWKASSHDTYEVIIFNRTLKALLAFSYIQAKEFIKPYYRFFIKPMLKKIRFLTSKI